MKRPDRNLTRRAADSSLFALERESEVDRSEGREREGEDNFGSELRSGWAAAAE